MISNRRLIDTSGPDFYPTPEWGTQALLRYVEFSGDVLEPCCGDGAMAGVIQSRGYNVSASDIFDHGYGDVGDFFDRQDPCDNVITNPPFNIAADLLEHALSLARFKVCFLLRTAFLESQSRYHRFYSKRPPARVLVFSERLSMYPKGHPVRGGGTTSYSWFIWDRELSPERETTITWIAPGLKPKHTVKEQD